MVKIRMRRALAVTAAATVAVGAVTAVNAVTGSAASPSTDCPWATSTAPIGTRVNQVLRKMTLDEKITMVDGAGFSFGTQGYVGHLAAIPRLCLPGLNLEDGPQGVADGVPGVTQLPAPMALASTFDTNFAHRYGDVVGAEERGKGADVNLGPTINIVRDPRWGRAFETYGEDPYLSGTMGAGYIRGVQSNREMAQVKHWVVYNQETNRNTPQDNVIIDQRTMREIYMRQFEIAIQRGKPSSVMCSYNELLGQFACQNSRILDVLKSEWHFPGFVTSDWGATHSTVASANAGLDMDMPGAVPPPLQAFLGKNYYGNPLKRAVERGLVPMGQLNNMVERILREMFRFDLIAHPPGGSLTNRVTTPEHAAVGRSVAQNGTVLLKNANGALPLQPARDRSIAVIGSDAGRWAETTGGGSAGVVPPYVITPIQGIRHRAARGGVTVSYSQGDVPLMGALNAVPASAFPHSLHADFYNNATMSGSPVATKALPDLNRSWNGSPASGVSANGWSATITGRIKVPATGTYSLSLTVSGSAKVFIDGNPLISGAGAIFGGSSTARATAQLTAGVHNVRVEYVAPGSGTATLQLGWAPPGAPSSLQQQAVSAAKKAKVAVVFANLYETEGVDLPNIDLPAAQNSLISAVARANPNIVVVLNTGSGVTMPWLSRVRSVVEAWYPGQDDGRNIAAVLFGDVNPSGKLPVTFPRSLNQVPANSATRWPGVNGRVQYTEGLLVGYRWYTTKNIQPLFPFGYGLTYSAFRFSGLHVASSSGSSKAVSVTVTNTGTRAGADVVQVYVHDPSSTGEPARQLRAFARVNVRPGQTRTVRFTLGRDAFAWWRPATRSWSVSPGTYTILAGDSSANLPLSQQVSMAG
jgi:beta-glucosidase